MTQAACLNTGICICTIVGVASAESHPRPATAQLPPSQATPFQAELVVCTTRQYFRHGLAAPAFVRITVGSRYSGSQYVPPVPVFSISVARKITSL